MDKLMASGEETLTRDRDPFLVSGPACISFSGGRTSAYMLRSILDAHDGQLPEDVHVLFANTGKEREETLEFVNECSLRWGVRVRWIEYHLIEKSLPVLMPPRVAEIAEHIRDAVGPNHDLTIQALPTFVHGWREVDYRTASRCGEPFDALIRARSFLPNPVSRYCTQELKIRPMSKFARSVGFEHWTNIVGLRADERSRVINATAPTSERWEVDCPLAMAGKTLADVNSFWSRQPFDLRLKPYEGNCDLCFLKARARIERILREHPELASWWIDKEAPGDHGRTFRRDRPSYRRMLDIVQNTPFLPGLELDDNGSLPCACTD